MQFHDRFVLLDVCPACVAVFYACTILFIGSVYEDTYAVIEHDIYLFDFRVFTLQ